MSSDARVQETFLEEFSKFCSENIYRTLDELQADLDVCFIKYNQERPHNGQLCYGRTPMRTFNDSLPLAKNKRLDPKYDKTSLTAV